MTTALATVFAAPGSVTAEAAIAVAVLMVALWLASKGGQLGRISEDVAGRVHCVQAPLQCHPCQQLWSGQQGQAAGGPAGGRRRPAVGGTPPVRACGALPLGDGSALWRGYRLWQRSADLAAAE